MCISIINRQGVVHSRIEQQMLIIARVVVIVVFLRPRRRDRAAMVLRTSSASDGGQNRSSATYRREFSSTHFSPLPEKFLLVVFGVRVTDAFEPFVNSDWYRYELSNVADDPGRTSTILPENAPIVRNSLAR